MQRSQERFELSPEEYFAGVDRSFGDLRARLGTLDGRVDAVTALCEELTRTRLLVEAVAPPPARWSYDVRLPNYLFDDVFEPETNAGAAKRWVGASGRVGATLRLPRNVQYDLSIQIEDFASEAAAKSFFLRIDGVQYPWLSHAGKRYASLVLVDDETDALAFEIGVDPAALPAGGDVSFSFNFIDIVRHA